MLFISFLFLLLFLPVCLAGYFGLNHFHRYNLAKAFLLGMSLWFYGYFHAAYLHGVLGLDVSSCSGGTEQIKYERLDSYQGTDPTDIIVYGGYSDIISGWH